jgi:hypothetical protein
MPFLDQYVERSAWTPQQSGIVNLLGSLITGGYDGIGGLSPYNEGEFVYGGQLSPDATLSQQTAFNAAGGLLGSNPAGTFDTRPAMQNALSGNPAYQIDPAARDRYFSSAIEAPARAAYQDSMQELDHRYGARFGRAGSQLEAGQRNAGRFNTELSAQRADMHWQDELMRRQSMENAANRQIGGIGAATTANQNAQNNRLANMGAMLGAGGVERQIAGQGLAEEYGRWQSAQPYNNPWLGFLSAALTPEPRADYVDPGSGGMILGALGSGLSMLGGLG